MAPLKLSEKEAAGDQARLRILQKLHDHHSAAPTPTLQGKGSRRLMHSKVIIEQLYKMSHDRLTGSPLLLFDRSAQNRFPAM